MIELKEYMDGVRDRREKILLWIAGEDKAPVAMRTYIKEVFTYEGNLAGLGISPRLDTEYMEYIPMDEVLKFSMVPDEMMKEYFESATTPPPGNG